MDLINDDNATRIRIRAVCRDILAYVSCRETVIPNEGEALVDDVLNLLGDDVLCRLGKSLVVGLLSLDSREKSAVAGLRAGACVVHAKAE